MRTKLTATGIYTSTPFALIPSVVDPKLFFPGSGSGSYLDLNFGFGSGSGVFMKNTLEIQMIYASHKSQIVWKNSFELQII
jgi:hypothetical protein